jgi:hypothetical protein
MHARRMRWWVVVLVILGCSTPKPGRSPKPTVVGQASAAADVAALLAKAPAPARKSPAIEERESVSLAARLPAVLLLARRGESAAADLWHATGFDLAGEPDPYGALATEWVWRLYDRATTAHLRGAQPLALESLRVLAAVQPLVEAAAAQRRIARRDRKHPYLDFLEPVPVLLADELRRATRGPRLPLPDGPAMAKLAEDQRVALLVDHLDEVVAPDSGGAGNVDPKLDPIVEALIDLGAPAVEPLIEVVASDLRLTRSIHYRRKVAHERLPLAVYEAAYAALEAILETSFVQGGTIRDDYSEQVGTARTTVTAALRAHWQQWKSVPIEERWYRKLADDGAGPAAWLNAASRISLDDSFIVAPGPPRLSGKVPESRHTRRGEPLRAHAPPSVTELMLKRIPVLDIKQACEMGLSLLDWDPAAGAVELDKQLHRAIQVNLAGGIYFDSIVIRIIHRRAERQARRRAHCTRSDDLENPRVHRNARGATRARAMPAGHRDPRRTRHRACDRCQSVQPYGAVTTRGSGRSS